ncbi:GbsR/MarR family transcriptional regulator [Nonomuraea sp. SBT364]|uniref:GbsR/MarR family transcriptional regulator n=1 Tax=Nonomuraea sp. SBT364 TaxID=1580530 RepID=UPI000ADA63FB|nr:helix-turn-helix domain-containing protein [Nonomuraea sp. SBT364]
MSRRRLTQQERQRIAAGLSDGLTYREIARRLDRPTSTITREIARNGGPTGYRPQQAHQAAIQRSRRGTPAPLPTATPTATATAPTPVALMEQEIIEMAVSAGMPRTAARVHHDLMLSEDGRRTAADLARRLNVSPASVSVAVNYLVQAGYARRERDRRHRRDIYAIDDDAWYHSVAISRRQTLETVRATRAVAETYGPDSPVGRRLAKTAAFLEHLSLDMIESADRWRHLLA